MSILEVFDLGKAYRTYYSQWQRFASWFSIPIEPLEEHWVLRNLKFSISSGESLGIIGQNGAVKAHY